MKQSIIQIDDFKVTIKEVTPRDAKNIVANIKEVFGDKNLDVIKFIEEKYDLVVDLTKTFIIMPEGRSADELGFSDIDLIIEEFKVVNKSFLDKLVFMGVLSPEEVEQKAQLETSKETSTVP